MINLLPIELLLSSEGDSLAFCNSNCRDHEMCSHVEEGHWSISIALKCPRIYSMIHLILDAR